MDTIKYGKLWIGKSWKEAILLSIKTTDCGIEEVYKDKHPNLLLDDEQVFVGFRMFGWGRKKYITRVPKKYNEYIKSILKTN